MLDAMRRCWPLAAVVALLGAATGDTGRVSCALSAEQQVYRSNTTLVEVDVSVRDRAGRPVWDLAPGEFQLFEDGAPQQIELMYLVRLGVDEPAPSAAPSKPGARPVVPPNRLVILAFDVEHMQPAAVDRAKRAALVFLERDFQPGDVGGILAGSTISNHRLTRDRAELIAAVNRVAPNVDAWASRGDVRFTPPTADEGNGRGVEAAREQARALKEGQERVHLGEQQASGARTLTTLLALVEGLQRVPGRKTVVLLSDGFLTSGLLPGESHDGADAQLDRLVGLAGTASVRFYALNSRGLDRGTASSDILNADEAAPMGTFLPDSRGPDGVLARLTTDTGGLLVSGQNDFAAGLATIAQDSGSYYVLGYRPTNRSVHGGFRSLSVKVTRPGVTVRARKGYLAAQGTPQETPAGAGPLAAEPGASTPRPTTTGPETDPLLPSRTVSAPESKIAPAVAERVEKLAAIARRAQPDLTAVLPSARADAEAGWQAYQRGDVQGARTALSRAIAASDAPPWVHYVLGWSHYALSEVAEAATEWEKVRQSVPSFEPVYFDLADAHLRAKNGGKALAVLRDARDRWPEDPDVYNATGSIHVSLGAVSEAIDAFEHAVKLNPNDSATCYNLAKASEIRYVKMFFRGRGSFGFEQVAGDKDRAIKYYRRTVTLGGPLAAEAAAALKRLGPR